MAFVNLPLSLHGRGYKALAACCLGAVGEGARTNGSQANGVDPSQDLLGNELPSQVFLSRRGREEVCYE
jgi:hypothetical protein